MDGGSNGMLSNDCAVSPFCNATAIHANYCDGASFASSRGYDAASGLHFAGANILNATVARWEWHENPDGPRPKLTWTGANAGDVTGRPLWSRPA